MKKKNCNFKISFFSVHFRLMGNFEFIFQNTLPCFFLGTSRIIFIQRFFFRCLSHFDCNIFMVQGVTVDCLLGLQNVSMLKPTPEKKDNNHFFLTLWKCYQPKQTPKKGLQRIKFILVLNNLISSVSFQLNRIL